MRSGTAVGLPVLPPVVEIKTFWRPHIVRVSLGKVPSATVCQCLKATSTNLFTITSSSVFEIG